MKRKYIIVFLVFFLSGKIFSQELNCNVQVVSQQVQGTNKQVFETLQNAIFEFMNNKVWTNNVFSTEERIECNMMFNITEQISADEFRGTLQIQARRPVFNSNYSTTMLNFLDNDIHFNYIEFEPLEFDLNSYTSNLTSILAYYAYLILALDYDSFSFEGGTPFWQAAEKVVDNAQNAPQKGWKPFDNTSHKNRYWLVKDYIDEDYAPCREFIYRYHRQGLDLMDSKVVEGRTEIASDLELLQKVYRQKPDPFMQPLRMIFDSKADEMINIFSESFQEEKSRLYAILNEIDQANANKYKAIIDGAK
ncbi:MAG: DUF4835 family protein [Bacteroidales bacterium]|nr:DUF4835 family protein [Bacteroidales bacterium]MCF8391717.1 DUF4835 family protein [Bacteroidales bacterium]